MVLGQVIYFLTLIVTLVIIGITGFEEQLKKTVVRLHGLKLIVKLLAALQVESLLREAPTVFELAAQRLIIEVNILNGFI